MRSLYLAAAFLASSAIASPAFAQEDERPFSGFYIGGSVGATISPGNDGETILFDRNLDGTFGDTITTSAGANAFSPGFCAGTPNTTAPAGGCESEDLNLEFSGRLGFDWQMDNLVIGLIGEVGKTDARSSVTAFSTTPANYTITRELDYLANLRARVGTTITPSTLVYGTAGVAYAKLDNSFTTTNTVNSVTARGEDESWGFVLGAGVEQKMGRNLSVGIEYLYHQLKDENFRVRLGAAAGTPATNPFIIANANGTDFARSSDDFNLHSVRAVVNFRF
jgi:outer membrane immunogenic protein